MKLTPEDIQLINTVNAHLRQVANSSTYNSDEATLTVITGSLRFLLADGNLARAWHLSNIRGPMTFRTSCIVSTGTGEVVAFCGGGDILPGIPGAVSWNAETREKVLDLNTFCRAVRIQVGSEKISTVELIQYVANALGGSHLDPFGKASKKPKAETLRKLMSGEIEMSGIRINDRNLVHHEILSIGQILIRSPEVAALRAWRS